MNAWLDQLKEYRETITQTADDGTTTGLNLTFVGVIELDKVDYRHLKVACQL
jgi:hypothetical protein